MTRWLSLAVLTAACTGSTSQPAVLALPGSAYYPESLNAGPDGTIYVPSIATGEIVAFGDGKTAPRVVLAPGATDVTGETGLVVHDDTLWICSVDTTFQRATEVRSFDLAGDPLARYPLAANQFCNDLAFDDAGNLYATDSFAGTILELPAGGSALVTFAQDARWAATAQGAFGLDGIAYDGAGGLYVDTNDTGLVFHVDLASQAVTPILVTPALGLADGLRVLDDQTLLVADNTGSIDELDLAGATATSTALADGLDGPTSVVVARGYAWASEGQLSKLFATPPQSPDLPFEIRRIAL
ncbi:MAG TPA: hypothetical protein VLX92_04230 [Kofleriaceae bacterium]|nr:hypothetical protein [Kofleriaceae bacterium]